MGLCLLVYTLAQRHIRNALLESKSTIKNQLGKATNRPTSSNIPLRYKVGLGHVNVRGAISMKPNKCVGLRCRLTQPTRNGQGIVQCIHLVTLNQEEHISNWTVLMLSLILSLRNLPL
ncbi:hypothetical protein BMF77_02740 [Dolichospermum sp. UHCC 0315A]|nr:hypothetical protein [Dolichospermum sp. UHCC 0315A]QEI42134.1 hypothetical protein BMF77_02740 [Dolichospermum sp. UHCC 0315A]